MKISRTRKVLVSSFIMILFSLLTFTFTTFAWFSDSVSSSENIITMGNLDAEMYWSNDITSNDWHNIEDKKYNAVFTHDNYEPGYTELKYLKIVNTGSLSFKYDLSLLPIGKVGKLAEVVDVYYMSDVTSKVSTRGLLDSNNKGTIEKTLGKSLSGTKVLLPRNTYDGQHTTYETIVAIALKMQTTAGNEYQGQSIGDGFSIRLKATQYSYEEDSFDEEYDKEATWPDDVTLSDDVTKVAVENVGNKVAKAVTMVSKKGDVSANIPAGVSLEPGTEELALSVTAVDESNANISFDETEAMLSMDVHIEGVAEDNEVVMEISLGAVLPKGLNLGNYRFYHVEDKTYQMRLLGENETPVHNSFKYDPQTGNVIVYLKSFSEIAAVADTENAWEGKIDYSWYDVSKTEFIISNADQLAAFGRIVGGMDGQTRDNFEGDIIKLISDINLGYRIFDLNTNKYEINEKYTMFHPIGYYYTDNKNADETTGDYYSTVYPFEGVFNGNGHKISNFYQNTWEIKGDYDGNYYSDAMGLFGYVVNGEIRNLHVDNFSSDGEFTPTGVIAAYAVNSTFENIAITNCNPRVYNTGNGGIVGVAGDKDDKAESSQLTFENITIDNSNKISALWGSWDVACGGIAGMFRGNGLVHFENCHVAAQIDVYNDVCGNYQYYWYRYAGMMIGSIRGKSATENGYNVPDLTGITATGCTVHFGEWNDYYYCELVANSLASYTHDHQFSRLEQIGSLDEIKSGESWTKTGNFLLINGDTKTCYHIVKNSDGTLKQHLHTDSGEEVVNGKTVLKEDNQIVYLPFNQLFQGDGWGVKHVPFDENSVKVLNEKGIEITLLDREIADSQVKFEVKPTENNIKYQFTSGVKVEIGNIFSIKTNLGDNKIDKDNVRVTVSPVEKDNKVTFVYEGDSNDWTKGTLAINGTGLVEISITDYYYCVPTTVVVNVNDINNKIEKYKTNFVYKDNYLYRIGNQNSVSLNSLFNVYNYTFADDKSVNVVIESMKGNTVSEYTQNTTDWKEGTIKFSNTGVVKVTIKDDFSLPFDLYLEIVDAVNATGATNATSNNVVLLNDCTFSSLEVSGGYTLYGNGFTMTCATDSAALNTGYEFVALNNGTLDNVQIVCPNFDYAVLYSSNMTESGNRKETTDKTRYFNVKSAVEVNGNSKILNSRISGGRAAVNIVGGNAIIDNSRIELGAVANILIGTANSVILRDVTLVQKPTPSTYDSNKIIMGFSVLTVCDSEGNSTPITLEGKIVQNAWVKESYKKYVPSAGQSIISTVLGKTEYLHDIDGDGTNESLNLGFAYMPESLNGKVNTTTITDNRTNNNDIPYDYAEVSILNGKTYVYSYKNTKGTTDSFKTESEYKPNKYGDIITVNYSDIKDGLEQNKSFETDDWVYELNVDLDKLSGYALDFNKLSMSINGVTVTDFKVNDEAKPISPIAVTTGGATYKLTATIDGKEYTTTFKVTGTETSKESPTLVGTPKYGTAFGVANSYGGDWSAAAPVLDGITIKYWSVADSEYKEVDLSSISFANTGKQNGSNSYWEYTHTDNDFTLKLTNTVAMHDKSQTFGIPVAGKDGKLYFTIAGTGGFVSNGTSSRAITIKYEFTDNNGGDTLVFTNKWDIPYNKDEQYNYNSFVKDGTLTKLEAGSSGGDNCLAEGTLITMNDGTKRAVEDLRKGDLVMAFDHLTGEVTFNKVIIVVKTQSDYYKNTFVFDDGTELVTINEHGIYDLDLNKYVNIDHLNYLDYLGHRFVSIDVNGNISSKVLVDVKSIYESGYKYDIVTNETLNYVAEDTLSVTHVLVDVINTFEFDQNMKYDQEKMMEDINKYGLYEYDEWSEYCDIKVFEEYNIPVMKVGISKGLYTKEYIISLINTFVLDDSVQIISE